MSPTLVSVLVVLALILVEALFVASEIALVSLRESQVESLAQQGHRGHLVAKLIRDQNRWLATVQIGVTLTALLSSAYGAITLSDSAKEALMDLGWSRGLSGFVGVVGVTLAITFVTLVIGELAPKRLALQRSETVAMAVAPFLNRVSAICRPAIWALSVCTNGVVRLFGGDPNVGREAISSEELRLMVAGNETLNSDERELIEEVFQAGDRQLREVLLPRTEVTFLDGDMPIRQAARIAASNPHSRYPVIDGSADNVIGFVHVRDFLNPELAGRSIRLEEIARPVKMLPTSKQVLAALSEMRAESTHLAIVVDEYGGTAGIVTLEDLIEELIGDIQDEYDVGQAGTTRLVGGVMEVDGLLNLDDFLDETGIALPDGPYETAAGYIVAQLGRLAAHGDEVVVELQGSDPAATAESPAADEFEPEVHRYQLLVVEMDGRRIARIRITRLPERGAAPVGPPVRSPEAEEDVEDAGHGSEAAAGHASEATGAERAGQAGPESADSSDSSDAADSSGATVAPDAADAPDAARVADGRPGHTGSEETAAPGRRASAGADARDRIPGEPDQTRPRI